jgi:hypothetical protein
LVGALPPELAMERVEDEVPPVMPPVCCVDWTPVLV